MFEGKIYKHFNGDYYLVLNIATHSETDEKMVVYKALYGDSLVYVRTLDMFTEIVNKNGQKHRFELQDIKSVNNRDSEGKIWQ